MVCNDWEAVRDLLDRAKRQDPEAYDEIINRLRQDGLGFPVSTLLFALENYPAEPLLELAIHFSLNGNWEVAHQACLLLDKIDEISGSRAEAAWHNVQAALKSPNLEIWRKELIEQDVLPCFVE